MNKLITSSQKENVGKIIDSILRRRYPGEVRDILFEELLDWDMWQTFIKIYSKLEHCFIIQNIIAFFSYTGSEAMITHRSEYKLSDKCITLCTSAKSILENVFARLISGEITLKELTQMKDSRDHLQKMFDESLSSDELKIVRPLLEQRCHEMLLFAERLRQLRLLCQHIKVEIMGMLYACIGVSWK